MKTKEELPECPVATAVALIGGKWKLLILRNLKIRPWRFRKMSSFHFPPINATAHFTKSENTAMEI